MTEEKLKIRYLSPGLIKPNPKNPRKHSRDQIQALAKSIDSFGFNAPILIDRNDQVVAGHGRLDAAIVLDLAFVPVIRLENLSEAQAKAYMLADNKLSDRSTWDEPILAGHLKELSEMTLDFDLEDTAFETPEIDVLVQSLDEQQPIDKADMFEFAQPPAVSRVGDLWCLDNNFIACGDALDRAVYARFPGHIRPAAVFMDPPYNVKINGHVSGRGEIQHREFLQGAGEMSQNEFTEFLARAFDLVKEHIKPGGLIYACQDWRHMREMLDAGRRCSFQQVNLAVWVKSNGGMGSFYRSRHELIFVFRYGDESHRNNVQLGKFGRNRTNVWHYAGANVPSTDKALQYHPTPKPISLVANAVMDCTVRGEYVLDPFLGSGTTLLAATKTRRKAICIELDPLYVDTAILRWQKMTGQVAQLSTGQSFDEVKAERSGQ